ncbi:hypothetical protein H671_6g15946 [Cricetulus griseus]|nr:hypothetical protein H671_6g15946 [Cricetulus griseus]
MHTNVVYLIRQWMSVPSCNGEWMWHYVRIVFIGGENFGFAFLNAKINNVHQKMAMFMGMWHYIGIVLFEGDNFGIAYLNAKVDDTYQKMAMLMDEN